MFQLGNHDMFIKDGFFIYLEFIVFIKIPIAFGWSTTYCTSPYVSNLSNIPYLCHMSLISGTCVILVKVSCTYWLFYRSFTCRIVKEGKGKCIVITWDLWRWSNTLYKNWYFTPRDFSKLVCYYVFFQIPLVCDTK